MRSVYDVSSFYSGLQSSDDTSDWAGSSESQNDGDCYQKSQERHNWSKVEMPVSLQMSDNYSPHSVNPVLICLQNCFLN
jgi:hypothetical protein